MKRVTIVGVGALGSHVALFLRNEAHLHLIDFDRVEHKNLLSQFHSKKSVGKNKARALEQVFDFLFESTVSSNTNKLVEDNAQQLLGKSDLIIDCVDNSEARLLIQGFSRCDVLHGGIDAEGSFGRVQWDEQFEIDEGVLGAATCENGEHLPFIATTAAYIARAAQQFLKTGRKNGFLIHPGGVERT